MAVPQQKIREIMFQLLFSYDMADPQAVDMETLLMKELSVTRKTLRVAQEKVDSVLSRIDEIDQLIASTVDTYDFSRIQVVEKNILRLGLYELFYDDDIPPKVAIAEAMRLARKFSTKEAASFVNAVLDALKKKSEGQEVCTDNGEIVQTFNLMIESEQASHEAAQSCSDEEGDSDVKDSRGCST